MTESDNRTGAGEATEPGMFCLVLHSHLPWLANHGRWPVGEEWLYQSWAASYLPLTAMLRRLSDEGRSHLLTLGITPVLAAQLDDPHCLAGCTTGSGTGRSARTRRQACPTTRTANSVRANTVHRWIC